MSHRNTAYSGKKNKRLNQEHVTMIAKLWNIGCDNSRAERSQTMRMGNYMYCTIQVFAINVACMRAVRVPSPLIYLANI